MEANQLAGNRAGLFDLIAVCLIVAYQKVLSPIKGFSCAHRYRHGGPSCSEYVKQVVRRKGVVSGYTDICSRFSACKSAARQVHRRSPKHQAGVLDCGLDSCGDFGNIDSCFGGSGVEGGGKPSTIIVLPVGIFVILLLFGAFTWLKGPEVSAIEIRLIEGRQEAQEQGVARLIGGKNPDYQVVFRVNGKNVETNTLTNSSAGSWLKLQPKYRFEIADIEKITVLNKQVLEDVVLDRIDNPARQGVGEYYEYRLSEE